MTGFLRQVLREKGGLAGFVLVLLILLLALLGPLFAPDPNKIDVLSRFGPPSLHHLMGTDNLGRDLFARVSTGTRTALFTAVVVVGLALAAGLFLGMLAGYLGGKVESLIVMLFDIVSSFPIYILIFAVVALYGAGLDRLIGIMALVFTPQFGRMARAQMLALRQRSFIEVEVLMGLSTFRILRRHVLPNVIGPLIVVGGMTIPAAISVEAAISFLGMGVQPPSATLGTLIRDGYVYLDKSWWPTIASALVLCVLTLGSTLWAEAARDAFDPKQKGTR
jgi:peptide/nickel transport system permease protein